MAEYTGYGSDDDEVRRLAYAPYASRPQAISTGQNTSTLGDFGTDIKRGIQKLPTAITGLADIPVAAITGDRYISKAADYLGDVTGFNPDQWANEAEAEYSPKRQQQIQEAQATEGFLPTVGHYLSNPSHLAGVALESLPSIVLGGAYSRAAQGLNIAKTAIGGAAMGEGAVMAGQAMDNMVDQGADPRVAAALAATTGVIGGLIGKFGGQKAADWGLIDPDVALAGGARATAAAGAHTSITQKMAQAGQRIAGGAFSEGVLEEMPQSTMEQVLQNLATGKPAFEGVPEAAATGLVAGGAMGGAFNILGPRSDAPAEEAPPAPAEPAAPPAEPAAPQPSPEEQANATETEVPAQATAPITADLLKTVRAKSTREALQAATTVEEVDAALKGKEATKYAQAIKASDWYKSLQPAATEAPATPAVESPVVSANITGNWKIGFAVTAKRADGTEAVKTFKSMERAKAYQNSFGVTKVGGLEALPKMTPAAKPAAKGKKIDTDAAVEKEIAALDDLEIDVDSLYRTSDELTKEEAAAKKALEKGAGIPTETTPNVFPDTLDEVERAEATGHNKPKLDSKGVKVLAALYRGYVPSEHTRATGSKTSQPNTAQRALYAYVQRNAGDAEVIGIMDKIHQLLRQIDDARKDISTGKMLYVDKNGQLKKKDTSIDLRTADQAAYEKTGELGGAIGSEQLAASEAIGGDTKTKTIHYKNINKENYSLNTTKENIKITNYPGYRGLLHALAERFAELENKVGRNNILAVQTLTKSQMHNKTLPSTTKALQTEEPGAIRFSQMYNKYRHGSIMDMGLQYNLTREEWAQMDKSKKVGDKPITYTTGMQLRPDAQLATNKLSQIIEKNMAKKVGKTGAPKHPSPAHALLAYIRDIPMMPMGNLLASRLLAIMDQSQYAQARGMDPAKASIGGWLMDMKITVMPQKAGPDGKRAHYDALNNEIVFWQTGANPTTIIHEFLHAATVGFIKNNPGHDAVKALNLLRKDLLRMQQEDPDQVKKLPADVQQIFKILAGDHGAFEFVTYGLTYKRLQDVMKARQVTDPKVLGAMGKLKNLWQVFAYRIKKMLGLGAVKDSSFEHFLDASSAMLGDIYVESSEGNDVFKWEGEGDFADVDLTTEQEEAEDSQPTAAEKATKEREQREKALEEERGKTIVQPRAVKTDVNTLDAMWHGLFNTLAGGKDWTKVAEEKWDRAGAKMTGAAKKSPLLGYVLKNVVDNFGTNRAFRDMMGDIQARSAATTTAAVNSFEELRTLSEPMQQAVADYVFDRDEQALGKQLNEAQVAAVKRIVKDLDTLLGRAKDEGRLNKKYENYTLADMFSVYHSSDFPFLKGKSYASISPSKFSASHVSFGSDTEANHVEYTQVLDKAGRFWGEESGMVYPTPKTMKFRRMQTKDGHNAFVQAGTPAEVLKAKGLAEHPTDKALYSPTAFDQARVQMSRMKTLAEIRKTNKSASIVSSLVYMQQDWHRKLETARYTTEMVDYNKAQKPEDKWVVDSLDDIKEVSKVYDMSDEAVANDKKLAGQVRMPGIWVKIPDDPAKWGDLAGKYMAGPVYAALDDMYNTRPIIDNAVYKAAVMAWKKAKTVYSPITHVNNVAGNFVLAYYHDIPMRNINIAFRAVMLKQFPNLAKKALVSPKEMAFMQGLWGEFEATGGLLAEVKHVEFDQEAVNMFRKWMDTGSNSVRDLTNGMIKMEQVISMLGKLDTTAATIYSNQDNVFRIATYLTKMENNLALGMTGIAAKEKAAAYAKDAYVNYNIHAPWIVWARGTVLPFIAWPYRMVPLILKTFATKPWKMVNTMTAVYALNAMFYVALGGDDDKEEEERKTLPDYMKLNTWGIPGLPTYIRMPFGEGDNAYFLGLGRMLPLGDVGAISDAGIPGVLSPSGPLIVALQAAMNHDQFTGKEIFDPTVDTGAERAKKQLAFLAKGLGPAVGSTAYGWQDKVIQGKTGPLGAEANAYVETARLLGLNIRQVNQPEAVYNNARKVQSDTNKFKQAQKKFIREELRYADPDFEAMRDAVLDLSQRSYERMDENLGIEDALE